MRQLHPLLHNRINEVEAWLDQERAELDWLQGIIDDNGLKDVFDLVVAHFSVIASRGVEYRVIGEPPFDRNRASLTGKYHCHIYVKDEHRDRVIPHLRAMVWALDGDWEKNYRVEKASTWKPDVPYWLYEDWSIKFNLAEEEGRYGYRDHDSMIVSFYRPAEKGEALTDTCSVELVIQESETTRSERLSVVCRKPKGDQDETDQE